MDELTRGGFDRDDHDEASPLKHSNEREFFKPKVLIPLICSMMIALLCGSTNAGYPLAENIQNYFNINNGCAPGDPCIITNTHRQTFLSVGLIGLYLTIFAGFVNDRYGSFKLALFSVPLICPCYLAMSFITSKSLIWLIYLLYSIIGFASGAGFLAALSIGLRSVETNPGTGIALVGSFMSLSLLLTNLLGNLNTKITNCNNGNANNNYQCWQSQTKTLAIASAIIQIPPLIVLGVLERRKKKEAEMNLLAEEHDDVFVDPSKRPVKLVESLWILRNLFFLITAFGYFVGISSGLIVITQGNMWSPSFTLKNASWEGYISDMFSVCNFLANLFSGWICDRLLLKRGVQRQKFTGAILLFTSLVYLGLAVIYTASAEGIHSVEPGTGLQVVFAMLLALVGTCFGSFLTLFPTLVGEFYGHQNFGIYFGYLQIGSSIASFVTPIGVQKFYDEPNGTYEWPLWIMTVAAALAALGMFLKKPTEPKVWF